MKSKQTTNIKSTELIADDKNFNKGSENGAEMIRKSFEKFGAGRSILLDKNNRIIAGNKSVEFSGLQDVVIVESDGTQLIAVKRTDIDLDSPQGREMALADNASAKANIVFDAELIEAEVGVAIAEEWGVEMPKVEPEVTEDDFDVDSVTETDIVLGDLFEIGEHRLLCGDSTDSDAVAKLMNGSKADMVFTSPPYNGNTSVGFHQSSKKNSLPTSPLYNNNESDNKTSEEYIKFNADIFNTIKTIASDDLVILYNINYNRNSPDDYIDVVNQGRNIFNLVETIIWEKSMAISLAGDNLTRIIEFIFVFYNGNDKPKLNKTHTNECIKNLWSISNIGANHETHKACFPIKLVEQGINVYAKENALLYEPFTGSGTTMVASHQLKRKCYGMELDPKYCQVIIDRMKKLDPNLTIKRNGNTIN
jgi:DNA modification methylase